MMEYQTSSATLSRKYTNGHNLGSKSAYDGVFSAPSSKLGAPSFASGVQDYGEIFGGSKVSSIPFIDVPELNGRNVSVDVRNPKMDYSTVFGDLGGLDFAVSYEELFSEPKKGNRFSGKPRSPAERANPSEEADHSDCSEKKQMHSRDASYESFDGVKKFSTTYNKINPGVKNRPNGTTQIAELHAVPGFTCLVDEITPLHSSASNVPVPSAVNDNYLNKNFTEGVTEGVQSTKVVADLPAVGSSKKKSKSGVVLRNKSDHYRSNSIDILFGANEYGHGHSEEVLPSSRPFPNSYNSKGDSESSMASKFGVSGSDYAGSGLASSPPYFDVELDANSFAAASVAALKRAIEEAEASMKIAKESMARKKEGLQDRVKLSSNNGWKDEQRREGKVTDDSNKSKGKGISAIDEQKDAPFHVSAGMREQNGMRAADLTPPFGVGGETFGTKAALGETFGRELRSTPVDHRQKEAGVCNAVDRENKSKQNRDLEKCKKEDGPVQAPADTRLQDGIRTDHIALDFGIREKSVGTKAALGASCEDGLRTTQVDHSKKVAQLWDLVDRANRPKETDDLEICEKEEVPVQVSSAMREQNGMRASNLTPDFGGEDKPFGTNSASGETCERELTSTQADFRQVAAGVWEAVQQFCGLARTSKEKVTRSGFEWPDDLKKECCEKPEECGEKSNAVKEAHKQDEVERKINVVEGAVISEENEVEFKSAQQLHDQEANEKKSSDFWEQEESEKKGIHEQEICEATLEDFLEPMNYMENIETQEFDKKGDINWQMAAQEWVEDEKKVKESCEEDGTNREQEGAHNGEVTKMWLDRVHDHPIIEMQFNDFHDEEENGNSLKDSSDLERIEKLQETGENEKLLRGSACHTEEKVKSQKETCESIEAEKIQLEIDQGVEDEKKFEVLQEDLNYGNNLEMANEEYNQDESGNPNKNQEPSRHIEDDEDVELILEVKCEKNVSIMEGRKESIKQEENEIVLEPVKDEETVKVAEEALYCQKSLDATDDRCKQEERENQSENWEASRCGEVEEDVDLVLEVYKENGSRVEPDKASINLENGMELEIYKDDKMVKVAEEALCNENDSEITDDACKLNEKENLSEKQKSGRQREGGKYVEVTLEVEEFSDEENMSTMKENTSSFEHKENEQDSEAVEVANDMEDKEIHETVCFPQDAFKFTETKHQMEDTIETTAFDLDEMNFGQKQNEHAEQKKWCNLESSIEELDSEWEKIYENVEGVGITADKEEDRNYSMSSHKERWVDDGNNVKAAQLPSISEGESGSAETMEEIKITQTTENHQENHQSAETMEQKGSNDTPQEEVELEKGQFKRVDDVEKRERERETEREREREREKLAVERAIREARERAFAEAREKAERAAAEKASGEARRRREKLGKTSAEANEKASEKAAMEAKLKAERAAVERATAEARERALERAMSEKFSGASKDDGRRQSSSTHDQQHKGSCRPSNSTYPSSSSHGGMSNVPHSTERFDGANGESAQRCKARSESHQRIVERAAKALAEKNMRDLLAQKEQKERNRLAETLDGDVKRWSSGKEGNLRALLSTLQYILGPDSGWQPIPLTDIVTTSAVKKAYRKATLFVHPDKLQQRGASIQQKYTCEKVFDLLKEAWNRFNMEER